jgi:hypothetical protein
MAKAKAAPTTPASAGTTETTDTGTTPATDTTQSQDTVDADSRVVPTKSSAVATLEDVGTLMEADAADSTGHGFQKTDVAIPFLRILQSNSPQVKRQNPAYIDGAQEGFFFNTVTQAIVDGNEEGLHFIPVVFQRQATLWWPREGGPEGKKGFVRELPIPEAEQMLKTNTEKNDKGKDVVKSGPHQGQELVFAAMYYGLVVDENGSHEPVAFPLTFTQIKKSRLWNALIMGARLPNSSGTGSYNPKMYGFAYKLNTVAESNAKGAWSGLKVTKDRPLLKYENGKPKEDFPNGAQLYLAARDFEALMATGTVKVKHDDMVGGDDVGGAGGEAGGEEDDKLPF